MTEQTQPTDAEIYEIWNDQPGRYPDPIPFARAVLAKWGTPAGAGGDRMADSTRRMIEGMSVSIDVSTGDHDAGRRYFGTVTEVMDCNGDKHGVTLLVQDAEPNFTPQPTQAQAGAVPLTSEQERAVREAYESAGSESYFGSRPQIDTNDRRRVFKAGFERGWDAKTGADHA